MVVKKLEGGVLHPLPKDFEKTLLSFSDASATWKDITPLARNEWICWIESAKKLETREKRILWAKDDLTKGKRRPCCWPGCAHRKKK